GAPAAPADACHGTAAATPGHADRHPVLLGPGRSTSRSLLGQVGRRPIPSRARSVDVPFHLSGTYRRSTLRWVASGLGRPGTVLRPGAVGRPGPVGRPGAVGRPSPVGTAWD